MYVLCFDESPDRVNWRTPILCIPEGYNSFDARATDANVIPVETGLLAEHVVEWEDAGNGNREGGHLIQRAAAVLRKHLPVRGVHDEVVGIVSTMVDVVGAWGKARHVEVSVDPDREVLTTTVQKGVIPGRDGASVRPVTCPRDDSVKRTQWSGFARDVGVVVALRLAVEDNSSRIVVLLIVEPRLSPVGCV